MLLELTALLPPFSRPVIEDSDKPLPVLVPVPVLWLLVADEEFIKSDAVLLSLSCQLAALADALTMAATNPIASKGLRVILVIKNCLF